LIAHSAALKRIADAADRPLSEVVQAARILGDHGLFDRPGRGVRNTRIDLASLANVALALAAGGPMAAAENVRAVRPLVPLLGTTESKPQPRNALLGWDSGVELTERPVGIWGILPGADLGDGFERLIDYVATDDAPRDPDTGFYPDAKFYRDAQLEVTILAGTEPAAAVYLWQTRANTPGADGPPTGPLGCLVTAYVPPEAHEAPRRYGIGRNGTILFPLIETLAHIWRESVETINVSDEGPSQSDRVSPTLVGQGRTRRLKKNAAATPARAAAAT
jgi:hypothetical protein